MKKGENTYCLKKAGKQRYSLRNMPSLSCRSLFSVSLFLFGNYYVLPLFSSRSPLSRRLHSHSLFLLPVRARELQLQHQLNLSNHSARYTRDGTKAQRLLYLIRERERQKRERERGRLSFHLFVPFLSLSLSLSPFLQVRGTIEATHSDALKGKVSVRVLGGEGETTVTATQGATETKVSCRDVCVRACVSERCVFFTTCVIQVFPHVASCDFTSLSLLSCRTARSTLCSLTL